MNILMAGEQERADELRTALSRLKDSQIDYSDGDQDEDYAAYDCIFDLNFDDDNSNFPVYASLRDKPVFVSAVKLSLNEAAYTHAAKVKCMLFGINAMPAFISQPVWEISLYRKFQTPALAELMKKFGIAFVPVEDRVGLVKLRIISMIINEACYTLQEGTANIADIDMGLKLGTNYPFGPFEWCDKIGISQVFETLAALYEDEKDERYKICPLLKTKYLRNEKFYRMKEKEE
jgi:3-hydroxybutyryl-CoA dehydrogenase